MGDESSEPDYSDPELIAALDYYMRERRWRQSELSRRTGINASTISDWLHGRYEPGGEALRILCQALGVSRSEFWSQGERIVAEQRQQPGDEDRKRTLREIESTLRNELLPQLREFLREAEEPSDRREDDPADLGESPPSRRERS